jgi:hypothetical protein
MSMNLQELRDLNACDDRCRGRCSKCPNDTIREAVDEIERLRSNVRTTEISNDEVRAAETAVFQFLEENPTAKKIIGEARHKDVMGLIRAVLQASTENRSRRETLERPEYNGGDTPPI